jgi:hypothetical protein
MPLGASLVVCVSVVSKVSCFLTVTAWAIQHIACRRFWARVRITAAGLRGLKSEREIAGLIRVLNVKQLLESRELAGEAAIRSKHRLLCHLGLR